MKTRLANVLVLGTLIAFAAGCPAKPPTTVADDETRASRSTKGKSPAPAASKAAGTASVRPSAPASTAAKASPAASPAASPSTAASGASPAASEAPASTAPASATPSAAASADDAPTAVTVPIKEMQFTLARITVKKGGSVTWVNRDTAPHTVKPDGHTTFTESPTLAAPADGAIDGGAFNATFPAEGEFKYVCGFHPSMTGTVVVVP